MKYLKRAVLAISAAGLVFTAACNNDYTGKEGSHPLFVKGMSSKASQNYTQAAEAFEGFLSICPKSAKTHKELAGLYGDYLGEYTKAIYHYEKYIELGKLGNVDKQDVRKLIDSCEKKFFEKYQQSHGIMMNEGVSPAVEAELKERISMLERALVESESSLSAARDVSRKVSEKYKVLHQDWSRLRKGGASSVRRSTSGTGTRTAASGAELAGGNVYTVKAGDTLSSIARSVYGKSSYWKAIRDANLSVVGEKGIVKPGQKLQLPRLSAKKTSAAPAVRKKQTQTSAPEQSADAILNSY